MAGNPKTFLIAAMVAQAAWTQSLGTVNLPAAIADPGTVVESVHEGLSYSEGPAIDAEGNLFFSEDPDVQTGRIWKVTPAGVKSTVRDPSHGSNGLEFDPQGRLVICQRDTLHRMESNGQLTPLVVTGGQFQLARVNDLSIASNGAIFFTNYLGNTVFYRSPDGAVRTFNQFQRPNGVEWIEEKSILYVASSDNKLQKCAVNNATGAIGACQDFAGGTDGLTTDIRGNVYRASWSEGTVFVHDSTGLQLGSIAINAKEVQGKRFSPGKGGNASNCIFGGPDRTTLYITGDGGCYKIKLKIPGRARPAPTGIRPGFGNNGNGIAPRREVAAGAAGIFLIDVGAGWVTLNGRKVANRPTALRALPAP